MVICTSDIITITKKKAKYSNSTIWEKMYWVEAVPTILLPKYRNWTNDDFAMSPKNNSQIYFSTLPLKLGV
jgi:hypothetical protein